MNSNHKHTIFVYGTLRQGASQAHRLNSSIFIGFGTTAGLLYQVDWYPGARFDQNASFCVIGELYWVTDAQLKALDAFEGREYKRVLIKVITERGEVDAQAWEYQQPIVQLQQLKTGDWRKEYKP
ncbi:MAG: gamma-glutamylcyclotransferase family protein [Akkermansiaceae bacterium]